MADIPELPQNVVSLVIAAREAFDTGMLPDDEQTALDKALERFASAVPYENEPTRAAPPAMDREAVDFLHQLRCVNMERYQAWASRPLMLCEHCGASEHVESERCAPPFSVQPHSFTKPHPSATVENDAGIMFDALELGGEVGELLNVVKKLEREERGWRGSRAQPADFADECADVLICLDKLARRRGVDLIAATIAKFNATSDKVGLPHKLSTLSADAIRQGEGLARQWSYDLAAAPDRRDVLVYRHDGDAPWTYGYLAIASKEDGEWHGSEGDPITPPACWTCLTIAPPPPQDGTATTAPAFDAHEVKRYSEGEVRALLRADMARVGGLRAWAAAKDIPNSRVSEFETGRRPASLPILVALGLTKAIVPLATPASHASDGGKA